jgi:hypothetical protein
LEERGKFLHGKEKTAFLPLDRKTLERDPEKRATAAKMLQDSCVNDVGEI